MDDSSGLGDVLLMEDKTQPSPDPGPNASGPENNGGPKPKYTPRRRFRHRKASQQEHNPTDCELRAQARALRAIGKTREAIAILKELARRTQSERDFADYALAVLHGENRPQSAHVIFDYSWTLRPLIDVGHFLLLQLARNNDAQSAKNVSDDMLGMLERDGCSDD